MDILLSSCLLDNLCAPPAERCVCTHPVVMCSLIWAVAVVLLGVCVFLHKRYKAQIKKDMADAEREHELKMKDEAFKKEIEWYNIKKDETNNEEINKLKEEIEKMRNGEKIKEIEKELKEKDTQIDLLKKQLDLYKSAMDNLHVEF